MKTSILFLIALLSISLGCGEDESRYNYAARSGYARTAPQVQGGFRSISPQSARKIMESRNDVLVVDVRTPQELQNGKIEGSRLISFWSVMKGNHNLPKDKAIILVCAVGGRSYAAGQVLARNGYREIYNLQGGIASWKQQGLPLKY